MCLSNRPIIKNKETPMSFLDQIKQRRTIYAIGKNVTLENSKIESVIQEAVKQSTFSFNSQTSCVVILLC